MPKPVRLPSVLRDDPRRKGTVLLAFRSITPNYVRSVSFQGLWLSARTRGVRGPGLSQKYAR